MHNLSGFLFYNCLQLACMTALNTDTIDVDEWMEERRLHCTERVTHYVYEIASSPLG